MAVHELSAEANNARLKALADDWQSKQAPPSDFAKIVEGRVSGVEAAKIADAANVRGEYAKAMDKVNGLRLRYRDAHFGALRAAEAYAKLTGETLTIPGQIGADIVINKKEWIEA
jgi:hypothetical protein